MGKPMFVYKFIANEGEKFALSQIRFVSQLFAF